MWKRQQEVGIFIDGSITSISNMEKKNTIEISIKHFCQRRENVFSCGEWWVWHDLYWWNYNWSFKAILVCMPAECVGRLLHRFAFAIYFCTLCANRVSPYHIYIPACIHILLHVYVSAHPHTHTRTCVHAHAGLWGPSPRLALPAPPLELSFLLFWPKSQLSACLPTVQVKHCFPS